MTEPIHPNSLDLEAFACGEPSAAVAAHLPGCTACTLFVERLRGAVATRPSRARTDALVARAAARPAEEGNAAGRARRRWFTIASTVAVPLAAAAALLLFLRSPETREVLPAPASSTAAPSQVPPATGDPETTFKGGVQVAVVRERAGEQTRFVGKVAVRPGDRLRLEVAVDREQPILAAVLGDDASWLELMSESTRPPGTHLSERSARVDASPMRATILAGPPDVVKAARTSRRFDGLAVVRIDWEGP